MTVVGFVGLGLLGARRMQIIRELGCDVSFAVDPDPRRRNLLADDLPHHCRLASHLEEVGEVAERSSGIFVAVPHDQALRSCTWALERGANILCEKPLGLSSVEAAKIRDTAASSGRVLASGFNYRYLPAVTELRKLLQGNEFGDLFRIRMMIGHGGRPNMDEEWKLSLRRAGGGALMDPGIHLIDLVRHLFGEAQAKTAKFRRFFWNTDVEDDCAVTLAVGEVEISLEVTLASWKNQFSIEVYGSDGTAFLSGRGGNYGPQRLEYVNRWFWRGDDRRRMDNFGDDDSSFFAETSAFIKRISGGSSDGVLSDATDGVAALSLVDDLYRCSSLPPNDHSVR